MRVVFVHIPKTGGTSLRRFLIERYSKCTLWSLDRAEELTRLRRANRQAFAKAMEETATFVSGHVPYYTFFQIFQEDAKYVTLLREPKARVLSFYYFLRAHRLPLKDPSSKADLVHIAKSHTLEEFLESSYVAPYVHDAQVRSLSRYVPPIRQRIGDKLTRVQIDDAKNVLRRIVFGVQERMEESTKLITAALNVASGELPHANVLAQREHHDALMEPVEREVLTPRTVALLDSVTAHDRELYGVAQELFSERVAQCAP